MAATVATSNLRSYAQTTAKQSRPNVILFVADQRTWGLSKATGYPLDTSPTLDRLQTAGIAFERNYCTMPLCVPSRVSMLTGRWANAHRVRNNLLDGDAYFERDIYQVARDQGRSASLCFRTIPNTRKPLPRRNFAVAQPMPVDAPVITTLCFVLMFWPSKMHAAHLKHVYRTSSRGAGQDVQ